jgi:hypothetical protein
MAQTTIDFFLGRKSVENLGDTEATGVEEFNLFNDSPENKA